MNRAIAIHGGAGTILRSTMTPEKEQQYREVLEASITAADDILKGGGSAMDAVCAAVCVMEDSPLFNAGRGSVFSATGEHEMDASVMDGVDRNAGSVAGIKQIKNPILLARDVMDHSEHVLLATDGALDFAVSRGYDVMPNDYFHDEFRYQQWLRIKGTDKVQLDHSDRKEDKFGTVGAVACDEHGNVAAATSTGGMTNKKFGRVGDSPLIGAGTYASNQTCAVSCTGHGEYFIRGVVAYDVSCLIEMANLDLDTAAHKVIHERMPKIGGDGGLIAVNSKGEISMPFNSEGMYRAYKLGDQPTISAIYED